MIQVFWWMLVGHAVVDYGLQSEYVATMNNRKHNPDWYIVLTAHAMMHGGAVALVTGSILLGIMETVAHWAIDFGKIEGSYGIRIDQALHVFCKVLWAFSVT